MALEVHEDHVLPGPLLGRPRFDLREIDPPIRERLEDPVERAGLVAPWKKAGESVALLKGRDDESGVRAWLGPNFRVDIKECTGTWCEVVATTHPVNGGPQSFDGWLHQDELWGVYKGEEFD